MHYLWYYEYMKKINTISVLVVLVSAFVLTGCIPKKESETITPEAKTEKKADGGVFGSIREAMSKSLSLKCEYPTTDNNKVVAYIKGETVMIDNSQVSGSYSGAIIKDNKLWTWDKTKKEGFIMVIPPKEDGQGEDEFSSKKIIDDLEGKKDFCKQTVVADAVFEPPSDVKFTDLSSLLKK